MFHGLNWIFPGGRLIDILPFDDMRTIWLPFLKLSRIFLPFKLYSVTSSKPKNEILLNLAIEGIGCASMDKLSLGDCGLLIMTLHRVE